MITWQDRFFAEDKLFHFTGSFTAAAVLIWIMDKAFWRYIEHSSDSRTWWRCITPLGRIHDHRHHIAAALVFLGGVALEWYQYSHGIDVFSVKDIIWNTAGIAAAWGVMR